MSNFCMQCGAKLEDKATACTACGNPVPLTSNFINKKLVDDVKSKLQNFSSQLHVAAAKAAEDIAQEAKKINEARLYATEESNSKVAENKKFALMSTSLNFLSKLSGKQKLIIIGFSLFLFICTMAIFEKPTHDTMNQDANNISAYWCKQLKNDKYGDGYSAEYWMKKRLKIEEKYDKTEFDVRKAGLARYMVGVLQEGTCQ